MFCLNKACYAVLFMLSGMQGVLYFYISNTVMHEVCLIVFFQLCINAKGFWLCAGKGAATSITGTKVGPELSAEDKVWRVFSSMGNIALASTYATVVYDIMVKHTIHLL